MPHPHHQARSGWRRRRSRVLSCLEYTKSLRAAETYVRSPLVWTDPVAEEYRHPGGSVGPGAATNNLVLALRRALRISRLALLVVSALEPVRAPVRDATRHIV